MSGEVSCLVWRFCRVRVLSASEHVEKKLWSKHEIVKSSKWNEFYGEWLALFWYILMIFWCKAEMLLVIPVVSPQKLFLRYRLCLAMITTCRESGLVELDMESARFGWPVGERPLFLTHKTSNWAAFYWILKRIDICAAAPKRVELIWAWSQGTKGLSSHTIEFFYFQSQQQTKFALDLILRRQHSPKNKMFEDGSDFQTLSIDLPDSVRTAQELQALMEVSVLQSPFLNSWRDHPSEVLHWSLMFAPLAERSPAWQLCILHYFAVCSPKKQVLDRAILSGNEPTQTPLRSGAQQNGVKAVLTRQERLHAQDGVHRSCCT